MGTCHAARALAVGLLAVPFSGCTLIGLGIGALVDDHSQGKPRTVSPLAVASASPGQSVELSLRDGSLVTGRLQGVEAVEDALYRERWKGSLQALAGTATLPGLGAVHVRTAKGEADATLLGLRPGRLVIRQGRRVDADTVALDSLTSLGVPGGGSVDGVTVARLAQEGKLPFLDALVVKANGARRVIPLEDVHSASFLSKSGKKTGAIIGAVLDAAVVTLAVIAASSESGSASTYCSPNQTCSSCPLVYGEGRAGLALEAEPLGGSLFAADEATDRALLARVEPRAGAYHVEIRNEMQEVEHLDRVRLLVVDHAAGVDIVPAMDGALFAVARGMAPQRAVDGTGANLAPQLAELDGREWLEVPLGRDPDDAVSRRATALLQFPRPPGAVTAVLDVSLRSTAWGMALLADVLGLQGRELDGFWARLEADAASRRALRAAWAREALPRIQVLAREGWRDAGTLAHVPTLVGGRRAVPLDLRDVGGDTLHVRIDALPGLWRFDRVALDYAARPAPEALALAPASARTADGSDARSLLAASDQRWLTLAPSRGKVALSFEAPPPAAAARSVLIEIEGYYRPILEARGEPQRQLFDRLIYEPGALTRYLLAGVDASTRRLADSR